MLRIKNIHRHEIVIGVAAGVGDLQNFAVRTRLRIRPLDPRSRCGLPISKGPLIARNARVAKRARSVQSHFFTGQCGGVRASDGNQVRFILALVSLP